MRRRLLRAAAAITAAAITAFILVSTTFAATPTPEAGAGDPRSSGEGPGLVGDPLFAIAGVLGVVVIAIVVSLAYIRLTGGSRDTADRTPAGRR